jgi:hypothetical protein
MLNYATNESERFVVEKETAELRMTLGLICVIFMGELNNISN